jgi:leader peptidase (prepilin peptidase)/N-methyltransferase
MGVWIGLLVGIAAGPSIAGITRYLPMAERKPARWWLGAGASPRRVLLSVLATALVCALLGWRTGPGWAATAAYLGAGVAGVALTVTDWEHFLLPDVIMWPWYGWSLAWLGLATVLDDNADLSSIVRAVAAGVVLAVGGLLLAFWSPGAFGLGDCKLLGVLGLLLGWWGWSTVLLGVLTGLVLGALWSRGLVIAGRRPARGEIALGPWLLAGGMLGTILHG